MSSTRPSGLRRALGALALARARLRAVRGVRAARVLAGLTTVGFAGTALVLRTSDGPGASLEGLVITAARWLVWLSAAPIALAAAEDRRAHDRREGIVALAAAHGLPPEALESARTLAAMAEIVSAIGAPLLVLSLLTAALAGHADVALARVGLGLSAGGFVIVTGVTLGGLAAACARVGGPRGRWLFVGLMAVPWMLADLAGHGSWSIPGALGAVLNAALGADP
jgi:hypothetical protein